MINCYASKKDNSIPIHFIEENNFSAWLASQPNFTRNWLESHQFMGVAGTYATVPGEAGQLQEVVAILTNKHADIWSQGDLSRKLPSHHHYHIASDLPASIQQRLALVWGLGSYQYTQYKLSDRKTPQLYLPTELDPLKIKYLLESVFLVRDLINTPTEDLPPSALVKAAEAIAKKHSGHITTIVGDKLLKRNFPAIYAVGKGAINPPCLIDLQWGNPKDKKLTLVGKGVCFDTGGLDLKTPKGMLHMKKDMAGAAHALGLASLIMSHQLPINLRVLIPAVENAIGNNGYRPGDIVTSRKGITVEITNTDAEGRVILADALAYASEAEPELIIDFASLTGAACVALGSDIPALFCNEKNIAKKFMKASAEVCDPVWELPLYQPYRKIMDSPIADMQNSEPGSFGGAITAALFLQEFVSRPWAHIDLYAWNDKSMPGRPEGGEAMSLRATYQYIKEHFLG